jgi:hypothetical protein
VRADIWLGIITIVMAVLGGIVSAHAPTKLWHKIVYVSAFVLAGAASIWLVIKISNENAATGRDLTHALTDLGTSTTNIASMTALNTELQQRLLKQSDVITDLSEQSIAATTRGKTFCLVKAMPMGNQLALVVGTRGINPLHSVHVQMLDVDLVKKLHATTRPITTQELNSFNADFPEIPFLAHGAGRTVTLLPTDERDKRSITFNFFSLNGSWTEDLRLQPVNGQWEQAMRVLKVKAAGQPMIPIYEWLSENYPKVNGKVDWPSTP